MTDRELILRLEEDPESGMEALIEGYSGLLWKAASGLLRDREDIRDCVSETFSEFYLHRERYDPERGKLSNYLVTIVRRRALRRLEDNFRQEQVRSDPPPPTDLFQQAELLAELDAALARLDPEEERILRMKYYQGMSAKEIAAALDLPYETVKKRHQRSLKKMRKLLTIGLIVLLLTILAACAYIVLRRLGVFPGYGITANTEERSYTLGEGISFQAYDCDIHLTDAWWRDDTLILKVSVYGSVEARDRIDDYSDENWPTVEGLTDVWECGGTWSNNEGVIPYSTCRFLISGGLPEGAGDRLELTLDWLGTHHPFALVSAQAIDLSEAGFYSYTEDEGGLLAVPRLENGELVVSIYPLNEGDFTTAAALNGGAFRSYSSPYKPVTVTATDGTVLEGTVENVSPADEHAYLDWYFGPAEPGEYVLNVPYVYQFARQADVFFSLPGDDPMKVPGGTLAFDALPTDEGPQEKDYQSPGYYEGYRWWDVTAHWTPDSPERELVQFTLYSEQKSLQDMGTSGVYRGVIIWQDAAHSSRYRTDPITGEELYVRDDNYLIGTDGDEEVLPMRAAFFILRWEHPFAIPMTVAPEPERPSRTETVDGAGVWATLLQSEEKGVTIAVRPVSQKGGLQILPAICYNTLPVSNIEEEPMTLIAADGTVYPGSFRFSQKGDYSLWNFGDLSPGDYTLHIPYLFATEDERVELFNNRIPLPFELGETSDSSAELDIGHGCSIRMGDAVCLGPMEEYPPPEWALHPQSPNNYINVAVDSPYGPDDYKDEVPPRMVRLPVELCSGEEFTLLQVYSGVGESWSGHMDNAIEEEFDWERESLLSSLLLRCHPEAAFTQVSFWSPVYRWNHSFDIPFTITEES